MPALHRRNKCLKKLMGDAKAALELLREISLVVIGIVELVFVFDVHGALITRLGEYREERLPINGTVAGYPETPPSLIRQRLDARAAKNVPENLGVLQMHVVNLVHETTCRMHGIHELPDQL